MKQNFYYSKGLNSGRFLKKIKKELSCDPAIPLLGIYPKETKTLTGKDIYTPNSTAALFTEAKTWKQPKCPLRDEQIKKCDVYVYRYICIDISIGIFFNHKKERDPAFCNIDGPSGYYAK